MNFYTRTFLQHLHIGMQKGATMSPALRAGLLGAAGAGVGGVLAGGALGGFDAWHKTRKENLSVSPEKKKDEAKEVILGMLHGGGRGGIYGLIAGGMGSYLRKNVEGSHDGTGGSGFR